MIADEETNVRFLSIELLRYEKVYLIIMNISDSVFDFHSFNNYSVATWTT